MKAVFLYTFPLVVLFNACTGPRSAVTLQFNPYEYTIQKKVTGSNGAVSSAHPLASETGLTIMKQGGNAIDAAIATQLALAVVYPAAGNIGGGGFTVIHLANGKNVTIDYREKAPAAAHRDMYLDAAGDAQTQLSQNGHLAAGVPGAVAGLFNCMPYAKLPFNKLIQPAIVLAEKGFVITESEARHLNNIQAALIKYNTVTPVFVKAAGWKKGDTLVQKDLATTLVRIRDKGMAGFYEGETARLIVEEMKRAHGIISYEDLKNYQAKDREPVIFDYKAYQIVTMPLPSSGGVLLPMMMHMIENQPVKQYGFQSAGAVQLMTEIERRAYADR
ncbi:MAG TPA: gamma-glutamyltransferase, partial [Niastella sp.]|nr:gamma-glutamyltransferase [Niastella sp.]